MSDALIPLVMMLLIFIASAVSIKFGISVAIIEIAIGVVAGNFLGMHTTPWIDFLAGFGSILLTFLAGAEVDTKIMKEKFKESFLIGSISFLLPFAGAFAYTYLIAGWTLKASLIAGTALSTTSLAVVYATLVETGLTNTKIGKIIMASCFITDFFTALALNVLFVDVSWYTLLFVVVSAVIIVFAPKISPYIFKKYANKVIEPEIKYIFLVLMALVFFANLGASQAVLPAFILGLVLSRAFMKNIKLQNRLRVVAFAMITPFFFIKGGMNVSLKEIYLNLGLLALLFIVKVGAKVIGIYPLARHYVKKDSIFTTLLMSTGLTFGTISAMFGFNAGIINKTQFSLLVTTVILTAIIPTFIAQKWFMPDIPVNNESSDDGESSIIMENDANGGQ